MTAAAITSGSDTTDATEVTRVSVLSVPFVERPSSDLNIQKKLLLTWSANIAPDAMASPIAMGEMESQAKELGANAVLAVDLDYETIQVGSGGGMLMVSASGTAVVLG